jgi:hypothetical protein
MWLSCIIQRQQEQSYKGQMNFKDEQLHIKAEQIEKLNENIYKFHIRISIQKNIRLNIKLLSDSAEKSKIRMEILISLSATPSPFTVIIFPYRKSNLLNWTKY